MNIFASSPDPVKSAIVLDDGRVNKMITESLQMLAIALHHHGAPETCIPKNANNHIYSASTHRNHPCSKWTRESRANYMWLVEHTEALCSEYKRRRGKSQSGEGNLAGIYAGAGFVPEGELTPFPNCTIFKDVADTHEAYRMALTEKWKNKKTRYKQTWNGSTTFPGWL